MVFHGLGYLSEYFIKHFKNLNPIEHYVICPQAPSKYYAGKSFSKVGACWLTKENTQQETENILNYVDEVIINENIPSSCEFIILGYSQGVSIASRWITKRAINCDRFIIVSGKFPAEINKKDLAYLSKLRVFVTLGKGDALIPSQLAKSEINKLKELFGDLIEIHHDGGHKFNNSILNKYLV